MGIAIKNAITTAAALAINPNETLDSVRFTGVTLFSLSRSIIGRLKSELSELNSATSKSAFASRTFAILRTCPRAYASPPED